jgi:uncharacterized BrkB/YihY/UPF0761 family membrane protein
MLVVLGFGAIGVGALLALGGWQTTVCGNEAKSSMSLGELRAWTIGLAAMLTAYCLGCAFYLRVLHAKRVHQVSWLLIGVLPIGTGVYLAARVSVGHWCF